MKKNAIVIGGMGGVGKGIVKALNEREFSVIIGDINADAMSQSDNLFFVDAASTVSVNYFVSIIESEIQYLDVLVITVGGIDEGSILNVPLEKWKWIFDVNLFAYINLVDAFLPLLEKSEKPRIMLTGSGSGFGEIDKGSDLGLYAISKFALLGYFKVLRAELTEKGIQVSLLIPSAIGGSLAENSAKMRHNIFQEDLSINKGSQPKGRILEDADIVGIKFVSDFLNGKSIIANNPLQLIGKYQKELDDLKGSLL